MLAARSEPLIIEVLTLSASQKLNLTTRTTVYPANCWPPLRAGKPLSIEEDGACLIDSRRNCLSGCDINFPESEQVAFRLRRCSAGCLDGFDVAAGGHTNGEEGIMRYILAIGTG